MSEYVFRKKLLKRIKCQNGHIVRFHNNSVEIKVQYSSNPCKLSSKVHNLVGRAVTVPTPSVPGNSPGRWVWWSDQRGSGMPFYWTVYPTCLSETLVFQYTSREILRQEESYKVRNMELEERLRILCIFPAIHVFFLFLSKLFACLTWSIKMHNECLIFSMIKKGSSSRSRPKKLSWQRTNLLHPSSIGQTAARPGLYSSWCDSSRLPQQCRTLTTYKANWIFASLVVLNFLCESFASVWFLYIW